MNVRQVRIALWSVAGICGVGALLAVGLAAGLPLDDAASSIGPRSAPNSARSSTPVARNAGGEIWGIELRRPLIDPPAEAATQGPSTFVPASMPALRVIGTVVEADHSLALLDVGGKTEFRTIGDVVNGLRIDSINDGGCVVNFNSRPVSIAIDKPAAVADPGSAGARPASPYGDR